MHTGHRHRVKERFRLQGLEGFDPHQALELLLFFCIPQGDVNPLAHTLIGRFGSLSGVLSASVEDLAGTPGVGEHTATLLAMVRPLVRMANIEKLQAGERIRTTLQAMKLAREALHGWGHEQAVLFFLDASGRLMRWEMIGQGSAVQVQPSISGIMELVIRFKPASVLLAHNHPGGSPQPSLDDREFTRQLYQALGYLDVLLLDHIIVGEEDSFSFKREGLMSCLDGISRAIAESVQQRDSYD